MSNDALPPTQLPLIDQRQLDELRALDARRGGTLLPRLVEIFEDQGPDAFRDLRAAIVAGDADALQSGAHALKGGYRSLGAQRAAALAEELEHRGRSGTLSETETLLDELERCFMATRDALRAVVDPPDDPPP